MLHTYLVPCLYAFALGCAYAAHEPTLLTTPALHYCTYCEMVESGLVSKHVACTCLLIMSCICLLVGDFGSGLHVHLSTASKLCDQVLHFGCQILGQCD